MVTNEDGKATAAPTADDPAMPIHKSKPAETSLSGRAIVALDLARCVTAIYVVLHHVVHEMSLPPLVGLPFRFGQEAVIAFFLLSGFLIYYHEVGRAADVGGYVGRRLRRIYPAFLAALIISALVAASNDLFVIQFDIRQLVGNMLMLQEQSNIRPGVIVDTFLGNAPLWSLSYEVLFYAVFPIILLFSQKSYVSVRVLTNIIGLFCSLFFVLFSFGVFNHFLYAASYFQIWWVGAMGAAAVRSPAQSSAALNDALRWLLAMFVLSLIALALFQDAEERYVFPLTAVRHFGAAIVLALVIRSRFGLSLIRRCPAKAPGAAFVASISYGLYLFHYPLLIQWNFARSPEGMAVAVAVLLAASFVFDRQLNRWMTRQHAARQARI